MRILFYLPVVTPWWFEQIILLLIEKLAVENEVHILAPTHWQGTGLGQQQFDLCAHLPQLTWHIVNDKDHPSMRTDAVQREQIIAFVQSLKPDVVLCRTADFKTAAGFPGIVRHITEGGADPLPLPVGAVHLTEQPFDHGLLPALGEDHQARLHTLIEPFWEPLVNSREAQLTAQSAFREWACLPDDRPILFLPLEYENAENFYAIHRVGSATNVELVKDVLSQLDGRVFLALTNHPLNELYVDNSALEELVQAHDDKVRLLPGEAPRGSRSTAMLMRTADGVLLGDSKCYSLAGLCGTPIIRQSRFRTGDWLNANDDLDAFVTALILGDTTPPNAATARTWFAYHAANNLISPKASSLTGQDILDRLENPFDPDRWEKNLGVFSVSWSQSEDMLA